MAKNLLQLQEIQVIGCDYLKMIVGKESDIDVVHKNECFSEINFTQLRSLYLESLPQLTSCGFELEKPVTELATTSASQEIIAKDDVKTLFDNKVIFPKVEQLVLLNLNIEKIWVDQFPAMSSCSKYLTKLTMKRCHNLRFLFSPSMVNSLVKLQALVIHNCKSIEGVTNIRLLGREEEMIEIVFAELVRLDIDDLPNLTTFGIANSIEFPSLRVLLIENCKKLKRFISSSILARGVSVEENIHTDKQLALFDAKVKLPSLEILRLDKMILNKIWHHDLALDSFNKLQDLRLSNCYRLMNIFPSNICRRLEALEHLTVDSCDQLEEIIEKNSSNGIEVPSPTFIFPRLTSLNLIDLSSLKNFYPGIHISEFPVLENLYIYRCNNVETLASELLNQGENQHEMEIQHQSFFLVKKDGLSALKKLRIRRMVKLKIWHMMQVAPKSDTVGGLHNLEGLSLSFCDFEEINELIESATQLRWLSLVEMNHLKHIWPMKGHGNRFQAFQNLVSISFIKLGSLKTLFPASVARGLFRLENLNIKSLDELEEIVAEEEGVDEAVHSYRFVFPQLISLRLERLSNLKSFSKGKHTSDWPMLKTLHVRYCDAVKILASSEVMSQECQQPLFLVDHKDAFPCLEESELCGLDNLLRLWKENSHHSNVFENLKSLRVIECRKLEKLVLSSVSLKNLKSLEVSKCDGLINLMTLSTAKSLVDLKEMKITGCEMIEEIIELEVGEKVEDPIVFSRLEYLGLECLPSLTSFYLGNYTLEFPSLEKLIVRKCSKMKIFSQGALSTLKLEKLQLTESDDEGRWEGNLNSTIQKLFKEMRVQVIKEEDMPMELILDIQ